MKIFLTKFLSFLTNKIKILVTAKIRKIFFPKMNPPETLINNDAEITAIINSFPTMLQFGEAIKCEEKPEVKTGLPIVKLEVYGRKNTEDVLNAIFQPRIWEEGGIWWKQMLSANPATRTDVMDLQNTLDQRLGETASRETGLCPLRHAFYSQCFDELIRQVTIYCAERGLLLLRVRNEYNTTLVEFDKLYKSSLSYGARKLSRLHDENEKLKDRIKVLESEKADMRDTIVDLKIKLRNADLSIKLEREARAIECLTSDK